MTCATDLTSLFTLGVVSALVHVRAVGAGLVQLVASRTQAAETAQSVDTLAWRWTQVSSFTLVYVCTRHDVISNPHNYNSGPLIKVSDQSATLRVELQ